MDAAMLFFLVCARSCLADSNYSPSWMVKAGNGIPHLDYRLQRHKNVWDITTSSLNFKNKYVQSLLVPSMIFLAVGMIIFSAVNFFWFAQNRGLITTRPSEVSLLQTPMSWARAVATRKFILLACYFTLLFLVFVAINFSWYGFFLIDRSIPAISQMITGIDGIKISGNSMAAGSSTISSKLGYSNCAPYQQDYSNIIEAAASLMIVGSSVVSSINQINSPLDILQHVVNLFQHMVYVVGGFYTVIIIICVSFTMGMILKLKRASSWNIIIALIICITLILLCSLMMTLIAGVGDFCMSPISNLEYSLPAGNVAKFVTFYSSCSDGDESPFMQYIAMAYYFSNIMSVSLTEIQNNCPVDAYVIDAATILQDIIDNIELLNNDSKCNTIQSSLLQAVNHGICQHAYNGFYTLWLAYLISALTLLLTCATTCLLFEYLETKYWFLSEENKNFNMNFDILSDASGNLKTSRNRKSRRKLSMTSRIDKKQKQKERDSRRNQEMKYNHSLCTTTSPVCSGLQYDKIEDGNNNTTDNNYHNSYSSDNNSINYRNKRNRDDDDNYSTINSNNNNNNDENNNNNNDEEVKQAKDRIKKNERSNSYSPPHPLLELSSGSRSFPSTDSVAVTIHCSPVRTTTVPKSV